MPTPLVPNLLQSLDVPLGVLGMPEDHRTDAQHMRSIIQSTAIPDHDGTVHFVEVRLTASAPFPA